MWSEREDSNLRPPVPKTGALPGCATLRLKTYWVFTRCKTKQQENNIKNLQKYFIVN